MLDIYYKFIQLKHKDITTLMCFKTKKNIQCEALYNLYQKLQSVHFNFQEPIHQCN